MAEGRRHWLRWVLGGIAVLVVAAVAGPFIYIHFIEGNAPAPFRLRSGAGASTGASTGASPGSAPGLDGGTGAASLPLVLVADLNLPGASVRFDYQDLDVAKGHLVIAHMTDASVVIVNTSDGSVVKS